MSEIDEILRRSREARERIIKAGQQHSAQKKQLAKSEALLVEQEAKAAALREQEEARAERERARAARERRLGNLPSAPEEIRRSLYALMVKYDVYWDEIVAHSRYKHLVLPRMEVCIYLRSKGWSYPEIGRFCNRHHTSVLYACAEFDKRWGSSNE